MRSMHFYIRSGCLDFVRFSSAILDSTRVRCSDNRIASISVMLFYYFI